jgi:DNA-binding GntR family transcriptional regulator
MMAQSNAEPFLSKSEWAYRTVRAMILSGELEPGTSIDQQALAAQLGISTTPLREGLRRLEAEYYVISQDHREMLVTPMTLEDVEGIYEVRLELDPLAARLACKNMTTEQVRALANQLPPETADRASGDFSDESREFHRAIYAASGNTALIRVMESLYDQFGRYRPELGDDPDVIRKSRQEHAQMCDLLIERDADGLAELMRAHVLASLEHYRRDIPKKDARPAAEAPRTPSPRKSKAKVS